MSSKFCVDELDQQEALRYRPGQRVELKAKPGVVDVITEYDPMMVPPISLANDPKPRYAHELSVVVKPMVGMGWLRLSKRSSARPAARPSRVLIATGSK